MKLKSLFLVLLYCLSIYPQSDPFTQANHLFASKNYVQASQVYRSITNPSFAVLYNAAVCSLYQHEYGYALLFIKQAEKKASYQELGQLYHVEKYIKQMNDVHYVETWFDQLAIFCKKCILSISILLLQFMIIILLCIVIFCSYKRWFGMYKKMGMVALSLFFLCMMIWLYACHIIHERTGIVVKEAIVVYAGPDDTFYEKNKLHVSDVVTILDQHKRFYKIKVKKNIGWIFCNDIELI